MSKHVKIWMLIWPLSKSTKYLEPDGNQAKSDSSGNSRTRTVCYILRVGTGHINYESKYFLDEYHCKALLSKEAREARRLTCIFRTGVGISRSFVPFIFTGNVA